MMAQYLITPTFSCELNQVKNMAGQQKGKVQMGFVNKTKQNLSIYEFF